MTLDSQVLIAFLLYLFFWGGGLAIGAALCARSWLLGITVLTWVVLQERGTILVRLANFGGKFVALVTAVSATTVQMHSRRWPMRPT